MYTESQYCNSVCVFTLTYAASLKIEMVLTFFISLFHESDTESYKFPGYLLTSKHAASLNIQIALSCHFSLPKLDSECTAFYRAQRLYHLFLTSSVRLVLDLQHSNGGLPKINSSLINKWTQN